MSYSRKRYSSWSPSANSLELPSASAYTHISSQEKIHDFGQNLILLLYLTFICPCIANTFSEYNQEDAAFLKFIYFCKTIYMFQTVFPSIIRSTKLHIQRQAFVRPLLLPAASSRQQLHFHPDPARKLSTNLYDIYHCCVHSVKLLMMDRGTVRNK